VDRVRAFVTKIFVDEKARALLQHSVVLRCEPRPGGQNKRYRASVINQD
jgi:hypothetical protein